MRITPKQGFWLTDSDGNRLHLNLSYYNCNPQRLVEGKNGQELPFGSTQCLCVENIFERLAQKLMALHNTHRAKYGDTPHKHANDILDTECLYQMAVARGYSDKEITTEIKAISKTGLRSPHGRRQRMEELNNLRNGEVFGEICKTAPDVMAERVDEALREHGTACGTFSQSREIVDRIYALAHATQHHRAANFVGRIKQGNEGISLPFGKT